MTAGIEVINDDGIYQIDDTYRNLQLIAGAYVSGMTHYVDATQGVDYWYYDITVYSATNPVLALNGTSNWITAGPPAFSGGTFQWRIYSAVNTVFNWYVYDLPSALGNVGFEVYDAAGNLKFSGLRAPMKPKQVLFTPQSGGENSVTMPAGPTYAVHVLSPGSKGEAYGYIGEICTGTGAYCYQYNWTGAFSISGNVISSHPSRHKWQDLYKAGDGFCGVYNGSSDQRLLILDVTGVFF